jgi:hypothetical protein
MATKAATFLGVSFQPLALEELPRFVSMQGKSGPVHPYLGRDFFQTMAAGNYRPQWTWVAERGGNVLARAAWWAPPQSAYPASLDWFDVASGTENLAVGAELLRRAHRQVRTEGGKVPEYHLFLPEVWVEQPDAPATRGRLEAACQAGFTMKLER